MSSIVKSYKAVDLFKLICAILVVAIHAKPFYSNEIANYLCTCLCRVAVPFFFVFSSFIFYRRGKKDIRGYIFRLLKLYLFWFVLEIPFIIHRFFINADHSFGVNLLIFIRNLLIQNTFFASWYITALWQGMLIVWLLSKYCNKRVQVVVFALSVILALSSSLYNPLVQKFLPGPYFAGLIKVLSPSNSFIVSIPYCLIGKLVAEKGFDVSCNRTKIGCLLGLSIALFVIEVGLSLLFIDVRHATTDVMISLFLLSPVIVISLTRLNLHVSDNFAICCRNYSILIYLFHGLYVYILTTLFHQERGIQTFLLVLSLSFISAFFMLKLSKRYSIFKFAY